jgi:hypothetical protein
MSLDNDPEIAAAFSGAAPAASAGASGDAEIDAAFGGATTEAPKSSLSAGSLARTAGAAIVMAPGALNEMIEHEGKAMGASAMAGIRTIHDWLAGKVHSFSEADTEAKADLKKNGPAPLAKGSEAELMDRAFQSDANPLNWPSWALKKGGELTQKGLEAVGVPSQISTVAGAGAEAAGNVAAGFYGARKALSPKLGEGAAEIPATPEPPRISDNLSLAPDAGRTLPPVPEKAPATPLSVAPAASRQPSWEPRDTTAAAPMVDSEPARGGLPLDEAQRSARAQILSRVGIDSARESALAGDRGNAATDYQLTKFNQEPAGQAAAAQFEHEKQALSQHATGIVLDTGGTMGLDQDSLQARGRTIAAPFDSLRKWFDDRNKEDYALAQSRASQRGSMGDTLPSVDTLLKDQNFKETLLAKDQGGLLGSIQRQYENFKKVSGDVWTPESAENFRKWINQIWTPENSKTLGVVKGAIDNDVFKAAGDDIYGPARARVALEHRLLDDPKGISKAFDFDPQTPVNRATPLQKLPDFLSRLDPDQFKHVIQTLKNMPEEVQPQARQALAEIRAHYANKLLEAGSSTQGQWNAPKVSQTLRNNAANMRIAFADAPEIIPKIQDLDSAGRILKVDQSYPGAAAQASSALKRGMMSHLLTKAGSTAGAVAGGSLGSIFGPGGAVAGGGVGAAAGEALGSRAAQSSAERAALKNWRGRVVTLSGLMKGPGAPPTP